MLFITLNSLYEPTGGGIYSRALLRGFSNEKSVEVIHKEAALTLSSERFKNVSLVNAFKKSIVQDLISRALLQPTFLGYYFIKILFIAKSHEAIIVHNSRNGGLVFLLRLLFRNKKIILCFDNVENDVLQSSHTTFNRRSLAFVDALLLRVVEYLGYCSADVCTFITRNDKDHYEKRYGRKKSTSLVLPVSLPTLVMGTREPSNGKIIILFTASFRFPPNVSALKEFCAVARSISDDGMEFRVAGMGLKRFNSFAAGCSRLKFFSDPSDSEMANLFSEASIYLSTVREGSGMKTKVAEALRASLPVVATEHSLIGYDQVRGSVAIMPYADIAEAQELIKKLALLSKAEHLEIGTEARRVFELNFSDCGVRKEYEHLLTTLAPLK